MSVRRAWPAVIYGGTAVIAAACVVGAGAIPATASSPPLAAPATCRPAGPDAYVTNQGTVTVSVINNCAAVIATVTVGNEPSGIALSPGGATAYVANLADGTLSVIDAATDKVTTTITFGSPGNFPDGVAVSPDGARVYIADAGDHALAVVDTASEKLVDTIPLGDSTAGLAVSPDGAKVYVADDTAIKVIDTGTDMVSGTISVDAQNVALSPDGSTLYAEDGLDNVTVVDAATGGVIGSIPNLDSSVMGNFAPKALTVSPDGSTLYEDDQDLNLLKVFDTSNYAQTNSIAVGSFPDSVATTSDGVFDYVANYHDGTVSKINSNAGQVVNTIGVGALPMTVATVPPRPGHAGGIWLNGISCLSRGFCLAVGTRSVAAGTAGFAQARSRGRWRVIEPAGLPGSTDDALYQVSCRTAADCLAVGTAHERPAAGGPALSVPLAELWNGHRWTATQPPVPRGARGSELRDVSCAAAVGCLAVGSYENAAAATMPLSERWTGRIWRLPRTPNATSAKTGRLTAVSCTGTRCAAVGTYSTGHSLTLPLAENWRSGIWHVAAMQTPGSSSELALRGVSCGASGVCLAAGFTVPGSGRRISEPFTELLAGGKWHLLPRAAGTPANSALDAISCAARNRCIAVGGLGQAGKQSPLAEAWDGTRWRVLRVPGPVSPTLSALAHVSCDTADSCVAVGNDGLKTLAEAWNGAKWRIMSTPNP